MGRRSVRKLLKESGPVIELPIEYFWKRYLDSMSSETGLLYVKSSIIRNPTLSWSLEKNFRKWIEAQGGDIESSNWSCIQFKDQKRATIFCLKWGHVLPSGYLS